MPGPPPTPNEILRRRGGLGHKDRLRAVSPDVIDKLPRASEMPKPWRPLESDGMQLWVRVWKSGVSWITPVSDGETVLQLCEIADEIARIRENREPLMMPGSLTQAEKRSMDALRDLNKAYSDLLGRLGFTPSDRARLAVGEVAPADPLEAFREGVG